MVNKIWGFFIIIGILLFIITNKSDLLNETIFNSTKLALDLTVKIFPVMALWMGMSKIAEESGLLKSISKKLSFILNPIFPDIPSDHPSLGYISSNIIANLCGLGNAATPFGLKAMQSLQTLNDKKDTATRAMITFLVLNTSGLTIVPTTVISLRMAYESIDATGILGPCIIVTFLSTITGLIIDKIVGGRK